MTVRMEGYRVQFRSHQVRPVAVTMDHCPAVLERHFGYIGFACTISYLVERVDARRGCLSAGGCLDYSYSRAGCHVAGGTGGAWEEGVLTEKAF